MNSRQLKAHILGTIRDQSRPGDRMNLASLRINNAEYDGIQGVLTSILNDPARLVKMQVNGDDLELTITKAGREWLKANA